jgi:urease accessory protein
MIATDALALVRLLQLASPALPVGAYSYSQGLEAAIEHGIVKDASTAECWIRDALAYSMGSFEAPVLWRMMQALAGDDWDGFKRWNGIFKAGRETAELRAETLQMGHALAKLIAELVLCDASELARLRTQDLTVPAAYGVAAHHMKAEREAALLAYLWGWLENQVMAAIKAIPLGQSAGQRMLAAIAGELPAIAQRAMELSDDELSNFAPALAILSSRHETQYSRLFRS